MTATKEAAETWLDVMPAIPLARGCPVVDYMDPGAVPLSDVTRGVVIVSMRVLFVAWEGGDIDAELDDVRVDLGVPQGFGLAYRRLSHACRYDGGANVNTPLNRFESATTINCNPAWARWLTGKTTDADRLALAKALREVAS